MKFYKTIALSQIRTTFIYTNIEPTSQEFVYNIYKFRQQQNQKFTLSTLNLFVWVAWEAACKSIRSNNRIRFWFRCEDNKERDNDSGFSLNNDMFCIFLTDTFKEFDLSNLWFLSFYSYDDIYLCENIWLTITDFLNQPEWKINMCTRKTKMLKKRFEINIKCNTIFTTKQDQTLYARILIRIQVFAYCDNWVQYSILE